MRERALDCLVFSKDRACQLDLLLRSIRRYAPNLYRSVTVLATYSDDDYRRAYGRCKGEHGWASFWLEIDFEWDVRRWLDKAGELVSFLVDDDVFYRDAPKDMLVPFSLRGGDYDYPFSVDGNIYRGNDVKRLLEDLAFRNPTELEAFAHHVRGRLPFKTVHPCRPPCLVGVPANRVSVSSGMPHMGVDTRELNDHYLGGGRLRIPEITEDLPAHAGLVYQFIPAEVAS
jgi:hypothetical protein